MPASFSSFFNEPPDIHDVATADFFPFNRIIKMAKVYLHYFFLYL